MSFELWFPLLLLIGAALGARAVDRLARRRHPRADAGPFWENLARRACIFLALPALVSAFLEKLAPSFWQSGRHLEFDRTQIFGWSPRLCVAIALSLPFALGGLLTVFGLRKAVAAEERGLAGILRPDGSRRWVLWVALPFMGVLLPALDHRLVGGISGYPGFTWGTTVVVLLALIAIAWSAPSRELPALRSATSAKPAPPLRPWPEALAAHGIDLRPLASWTASAPSRPVVAAAADAAERLALSGAQEVAPELIEAVAALFAEGTRETERIRAIFAPDDCGQVEVLALAARLLDRRMHAATLVIAARGGEEIAAALRTWLHEPGAIATLDGVGEPPWQALVWVVEAQALSDRLLPLLTEPQRASIFGLIAWWHVEEFTGVVAANLWAISRRLHRLLTTRGRRDTRTLIFARGAPQGGAQLASFVRRLLPQPIQSSGEVHVEPRFPRSLHLHLVTSVRRHFDRAEGQSIQERLRHPALVAARVSVEEGWSTLLEAPGDLSQSEVGAFLQLPARGVILGSRLLDSPAPAGARLREVRPGDALALLEIVRQGGRAAPDHLPHHVGLLPAENPYVAYRIERLTESMATDRGASRRLVAAQALPRVVRRHLLLALYELPATRTELLRDFLRHEEVIDGTLAEIAKEGKLDRRQVRRLAPGDALGRLEIDYEYTSRRPRSDDLPPLDTVSDDLIEVREAAGGTEGGGVRMRLDVERLTIQAYPHRVFLNNGRRYRVREWASVETAKREGWIACDREEVRSRTWRLRHASVYGIEPLRNSTGVGSKSKLLSLSAVELHYEEEVTGALRRVGDHPDARMEILRLSRPIAQSFRTRALVLRFPDNAEPIAYLSLAEALRQMLPVHLGVEEDALDVVPLLGEVVGRESMFGLAVVDLYPGGVGLVDEIADDTSFTLGLLETARDWLSTCPCQSETGCALCVRSPAAQAANPDQPPLRGAALGLLQQVV